MGVLCWGSGEAGIREGGSDFRIHAGNIKHTCESQADAHRTVLALPVQKSGFEHAETSVPDSVMIRLGHLRKGPLVAK